MSERTKEQTAEIVLDVLMNTTNEDQISDKDCKDIAEAVAARLHDEAQGLC